MIGPLYRTTNKFGPFRSGWGKARGNFPAPRDFTRGKVKAPGRRPPAYSIRTITNCVTDFEGRNSRVAQYGPDTVINPHFGPGFALGPFFCRNGLRDWFGSKRKAPTHGRGKFL